MLYHVIASGTHELHSSISLCVDVKEHYALKCQKKKSKKVAHDKALKYEQAN